jgi:hypothetical protein
MSAPRAELPDRELPDRELPDREVVTAARLRAGSA